jgi:hypothetical protein
MKPNIRNVCDVVNDARSAQCGLPDGRWVPARPQTASQLDPFGRFKAAWMVFTGKADALVWPGQP